MRYPAIVLLIVVGALLSRYTPTACAADEQEDLRRAHEQARRELLARQREHYRQSLKALAPLPQHQMSDIMQLVMEDRRLELRTQIIPWDKFVGRRAEVVSLNSPAVVMYTQYIENNPNGRQFDFKVENYPNDDTYGSLHLLWRPGGRRSELSIESTEQTSDSFVRIFFSQGPNLTRLIVFGNDSSTGRNIQSFNIFEKDFATLRQRYPAETEHALRPIFRHIQQDAAFAPDPNAAWEVLLDDWPLNEQVRQQVVHLLPALNAEQSRVRNRAANDLASLGRDGAAAIVRLDRTGLSLEQNVRLDEVVSRFRPLPHDEIVRLAGDADFLLDCEYCPDTTVRALASQRLARVLHGPIAIDPNAPPGERDEAIERLRGQLHASTTRPTTQPS